MYFQDFKSIMDVATGIHCIKGTVHLFSCVTFIIEFDALIYETIYNIMPKFTMNEKNWKVDFLFQAYPTSL